MMGEDSVETERAVESFVRRGYAVSHFDTGASAALHLNGEIDGVTVGFGDSATLLSLGLYDSLAAHNTVFDPAHPGSGGFIGEAEKALTADVFITSVNAAAETGELVNIDGTGNRLAGSLFGHKKVYFVMGVNKLASTLDDAMRRARNTAAPENAKRLGIKTPCARDGEMCFDCSSPDRICNAMLIYMRKMDDTEAEIVLIDEALGY